MTHIMTREVAYPNHGLLPCVNPAHSGRLYNNNVIIMYYNHFYVNCYSYIIIILLTRASQYQLTTVAVTEVRNAPCTVQFRAIY